MEFETVIGLEVHIELGTRTKMFCSCRNEFGAPPNTHICPVCLGLPGALPVPNAAALEAAIRMALGLGCRIAERSKFDRKNYFYPDLPKGYQISQLDEPIGAHGQVELPAGGAVRVARVQLEEDAGKLQHEAGTAVVDFNRAGVPLLEIVSEPDLRSAQDARAYWEEIRRIALYLGVTDARMEEGSVRADANISVRPVGSDVLNPRVEIKNMNSFRFLERALAYEAQRQAEIYRQGGQVAQETRGWDDPRGATYPQRSKEEAQDYRYFPEPDLRPFAIDAGRVQQLRAGLPQLPAARRAQLLVLGVADEQVRLIAESQARGAYFDAATAAGADPLEAAKWITGELARLENEGQFDFEAPKALPAELAQLLRQIAEGALTQASGKQVLAVLAAEGGTVLRTAERLGLVRLDDRDAVRAEVQAVLQQEQKAVEDLRAGKEKAMSFLVGQVMRRTRGRVAPDLARTMIEEEVGR
ncbi:MAG: Asp-tRNA(Asn)/Glu-tRNA(Gln) amidotransferase subunit GatB [Thermaerobacter sp.]|nr:Asp-tRNA(Asn)/Glu-tRNA(Gln) amidotransferase subunit GatB [Thermaerobacter sp.]